MRIKAYYFYLLFIFWAILLEILLKYAHLNVTGLGVTLAFLTLIFALGIFLWRLSGMNSTNQSAKLLYIIGLGFSFYFIWNLLGIILSINIYQVLWLTLGAGIIIFALAAWRDRKEIVELNFNWAIKRTWSDWLLIFLILASSIIAFLAVDAQSDKLIGDGWFHLAILEKITSGVSLSPGNLWSVKGAAINPVYAFPIWHIFAGELSQILAIPAFAALRLSMLPLVLIDFMVIYSVAKTFLAKYELTVLSYLMFLILLLLANFYFLVAVVSPDSLVRMLMLPLILGLSAIFIFGQNPPKLKEILIIAFLVITMGLIHFTQLIEFVLILTIFLIVWPIFYHRKEIWGKAAWLWLAILILLAPYLIIFQQANLVAFLSGNIANYANLKITAKGTINVLYFYPLLIIPAMVLFAKKTPKLLILIISLLLLLGVSWPQFGLQGFFLKYFGEVFTLRALTDILIWLYWGFGAYLILWLINFLLAKLGRSKPYLINIILIVLLFLGVVIAPFRNGLIYFSREIIFNSKNSLNAFLFDNFWAVILSSVILAIIIYLMGKYYFRVREWLIPEPKNKGNFAVLILLFVVILVLPFWGGLREVYAENPNGNLLSNRTKNPPSDISIFGGKETVNFLQALPKGSVFVVSTPTIAKNILLYGNFYVAEYPYAISDFKRSEPIFIADTDLAERLSLLNQFQTDYILTSRKGEAEIFDKDPQSFEKVYQKSFSFKVTSGGSTYNQERTVTIFRFLGKDGLNFHQENLAINTLKAEEMPFTWDKIETEENFQSVLNSTQFNPVTTSNEILFLISSYRITGSQDFLEKAKEMSTKLLNNGKQINGALYFPYDFPFAMHEQNTEILSPPWYSGMAQGEALAAFSRLYRETNDRQYLTAADKVFQSFLNVRGKSQPWTVFVDRSGYYWIEEYPEEVSDQTLNGFIYGLFGVYDYYLLTQNPDSSKVLEGGLATLKKYLPEYRNPGGISFYCLKHKRASPIYHQVHIKQLNMLYQITGDPFFKQTADEFYEDYH